MAKSKKMPINQLFTGYLIRDLSEFGCPFIVGEELDIRIVKRRFTNSFRITMGYTDFATYSFTCLRPETAIIQKNPITEVLFSRKISEKY